MKCGFNPNIRCPNKNVDHVGASRPLARVYAAAKAALETKVHRGLVCFTRGAWKNSSINSDYIILINSDV